MTESATLEPVVIDTIERYFDQLHSHVSAQDMIEHVLTTDFETGFSNTISLVESRTVGVGHDARRRPRGLSVGRVSANRSLTAATIAAGSTSARHRSSDRIGRFATGTDHAASPPPPQAAAASDGAANRTECRSAGQERAARDPDTRVDRDARRAELARGRAKERRSGPIERLPPTAEHGQGNLQTYGHDRLLRRIMGCVNALASAGR